MTYVVMCIMAITLAGAILLAFIFKSDAIFWEKMYRSLHTWSKDVHEQNVRMIKMCEEDIENSQAVIDFNRELVELFEKAKQQHMDMVHNNSD